MWGAMPPPHPCESAGRSPLRTNLNPERHTPLRERRALYPVLVLRTRLYKGNEEKNLAEPTHCEAPPLSWPRPTAAA